jgi:GDPmannose 4,6-dehydratase
VIATGSSNSLEDFVSTAFATVNLDWREHTEISQSLLRPTDVAEARGDPARIADRLGWKARNDMKSVITLMIRAELEGIR